LLASSNINVNHFIRDPHVLLPSDEEGHLASSNFVTDSLCRVSILFFRTLKCSDSREKLEKNF